MALDHAYNGRPDQDLIDLLNDVLKDIEQFADVYVGDDPNDPEVVEIIVRGILKQDLSPSPRSDPHDDYDRAMRGTMP